VVNKLAMVITNAKSPLPDGLGFISAAKKTKKGRIMPDAQILR
jgi:hypothetical protein